MEKRKVNQKPTVITPFSDTGVGLMLYGKLQPQNIEAEEVVIGALLLEPRAIEEVYGLLTPIMFYKEVNQAIFRAIVTLYKHESKIDVVTVVSQLRTTMEYDLVGGSFGVAEFMNRVGSAANIKQHALLIYEQYLRRMKIQIGSLCIQEAYDESVDVFVGIETIEKKIEHLTEKIYSEKSTEVKPFVDEAFNWITNSQSNDGLSGVPTGIEVLDKELGGLVPGELIVIAARPGMGKTALLTCLAKTQAKVFKLPIGIITIEMVGRELVVRMISADAEVSSDLMKKGKLTEEQMAEINRSAILIAKLPIKIDDRSDINAEQIKHIARRWKEKFDIQALYVDYLQIMRPADEDLYKTKNDQVGGMTRTLKVVAKTLNIPVIVFSQLSRQVEENKNKIPVLSNLRDSGAIEQDADVVIFLYRPEYYHYKSTEDFPHTRGLCQAMCVKNRNGKLFSVPMYFRASQSRFESWDAEKAKPKDPNATNSYSSSNDNQEGRQAGDSNSQSNNVRQSTDDDLPF